MASYRLRDLAERLGAELHGDPDRAISAVKPLATATESDLAFLTHARYRVLARESKAGALLVGTGEDDLGHDLLVCTDPYLALAELLALFHPTAPANPGVHPTAVIGEGATVDPTASVAAYAVVGDGSRVGARARVGTMVVIGRDCELAEEVVLHPAVVIYDGTRIGARSVVHAGSVIGADGFGYAQYQGHHVKIPQVGGVRIEEDVEIGANTTIDRATLEETVVGAGSKIDNLVQVGHNVRLGSDCILVSQSGIAGSSELGDGVIVAGQSGIGGHLRIGAGARVAAKSAVFKSIGDGEQVAGIPALDAGRWRRQQAILGRLEELLRRVRRLEEELDLRSGDSGEGGK